MGEFDGTKQADAILLLRGERFSGCTLPEDSRPVPNAASMTTTSSAWNAVGAQATSLADDLEAALQQLLKGWEGKAADEFAKNVKKVAGFARSLAHGADSDNESAAADGTTNSFTVTAADRGYKQVFTDFASDITTYTGTSTAPPLPWEPYRWWWKWYSNPLHFNYEIRDSGGVVNGDINGDKFVDFMNSHGIRTHDSADGLVSHPLPDGWDEAVKAFEAKDLNASQQTECQQAGNNLADKYKDLTKSFATAPQPPTFSSGAGAGDPTGAAGAGAGGAGSGGVGSLGGGSGSFGGGSGSSGGAGSFGGGSSGSGSSSFTPTDYTGSSGSNSGTGSGSFGTGTGSGSGSFGTGTGSGSGDYGTGTGSGTGDHGTASGSYGSGPGSGSDGYDSGSYGGGDYSGAGSDGSGSDSYGIGSGSYGSGAGSYGSGAGSYGSGAGSYGTGDYPGSGSHGWDSGSTDVDTGGELAGYDGSNGSSGGLASYGSGDSSGLSGLGGSGSSSLSGFGGSGSTAGAGSGLSGSGLSASGVAGSGSAGGNLAALDSGGTGGSAGSAGGAGSAASGATGSGAAGGSGGGSGGGGMMAPMVGGGTGGGGQSEHETWLVEDEDVWGARDDDAAPPVIGGSV